jgi:hypothetical protein
MLYFLSFANTNVSMLQEFNNQFIEWWHHLHHALDQRSLLKTWLEMGFSR